jgi:hypothetical protein
MPTYVLGLVKKFIQQSRLCSSESARAYTYLEQFFFKFL